MVLLSVIQLTAVNDIVKNLKNGLSLIEQVMTQNARTAFICLPEAFDYIGTPVEKIPSEFIISEYARAAKSFNVWLSLGGIKTPALNDNANKNFNTHVILDNHGKIQAKYNKIHLFDSIGMKESDYTVKGNELVVVKNTPIGNIGLTICYDLRFPLIFHALSDLGADVILVPSAFLPTTGKFDHWHTLLRARAMENQTFIVAAAQSGRNNEKRESYGHSLVVDPFGRVLLDMKEEINSFRTLELDLSIIGNIRKDMPLRLHRDNTATVLELLPHNVKVIDTNNNNNSVL